jgi:frataxin
MDQARFEIFADKTLARLMDAIDRDLGDHLDVDVEGGVLSIEMDAGGQYVINKHAASLEIWVSSPFSGASHFAYDSEGASWRSTRSGEGLYEMLEKELSKATGAPLHLA